MILFDIQYPPPQHEKLVKNNQYQTLQFVIWSQKWFTQP